MTDQNGKFFQGVGVHLQPGMEVEVENFAETLSVNLVSMTIDIVDLLGDTISGTAPAGAEIGINLGDMDKKTTTQLLVTASGDGHWEVSFSGNFDINSQTVVQATVLDLNGNGTRIKIQAK